MNYYEELTTDKFRVHKKGNMEKINIKDISENKLRSIYYDNLDKIEQLRVFENQNRIIDEELKIRELDKNAVKTGETLGEVMN